MDPNQQQEFIAAAIGIAVENRYPEAGPWTVQVALPGKRPVWVKRNSAGFTISPVAVEPHSQFKFEGGVAPSGPMPAWQIAALAVAGTLLALFVLRLLF